MWRKRVYFKFLPVQRANKESSSHFSSIFFAVIRNICVFYVALTASKSFRGVGVLGTSIFLDFSLNKNLRD